ncbi:transcriptional regulator [Aeromonas dhakensis]|uniref:transcriptional regulator n=1 Tax=Aeromonas dhakensis TaxID=196024 RepID=UPI001F3D35A3|nr:transcriptional regulator [Aeromonas dhakensis]
MEMEMDMDNVLAKILGYKNIEDYKIALRKDEQIDQVSKCLYNTEPKNWPPVKFNWDYSHKSQIFCFDGLSQSSFEELYPDGLALGRMCLNEFDQYLCHFSRRDGNELWKLGCQSKLARMIVYLSKGHPITPPIIAPVKNNKVIFLGGHHRYAVAKAKDIKEISLYASPNHVRKISEFMNVSWDEI